MAERTGPITSALSLIVESLILMTQSVFIVVCHNNVSHIIKYIFYPKREGDWSETASGL